MLQFVAAQVGPVNTQVDSATCLIWSINVIVCLMHVCQHIITEMFPFHGIPGVLLHGIAAGPNFNIDPMINQGDTIYVSYN